MGWSGNADSKRTESLDTLTGYTQEMQTAAGLQKSDPFYGSVTGNATSNCAKIVTFGGLVLEEKSCSKCIERSHRLVGLALDILSENVAKFMKHLVGSC